MTASTGNILEFRDVDLDFETFHGSVAALRSVSFSVADNSVVGIVGESGSGKSTVAAASIGMLAQNARVRRGEIVFEGRDLLKLKPQKLTDLRGGRIAMVFQDPMTSQNPVISVGQQLMDALHRRRGMSIQEKRERVLDVLRKVGIADPEERFGQYPHQFSGGMRQRISIAMALLVNPRLLIADEPTTALDVTIEAQIVQLIMQMRRELSGSVLLVSHNLGIVAELCDRVVVMYAGTVVEQGSVQQIFHHPAHPYTRKLLECDPALTPHRGGDLPVIRGSVPDLRNRPQGCVFADRCDFAVAACREAPPLEVAVANGHGARCIRTGELPPWQTPARVAEPASAAPVRAADPQVILSVNDLRVRFRSRSRLSAWLNGVKDPYVDAVLDVSLDLRARETFALVGESGSGKTSLGRAVIGLTRASGGRIAFLDSNLIGLDDRAYKPFRRQMSMMFQDPVASLSPRRTARALVLEPFGLHGVKIADPEAKARELFEMVRLSPALLDRYPHELSGGQARRVGVARALALKPQLVIADEPTAGLDVSVQGEILNLLADLQQAHGLSYMIISHNLPVVRHIADRLGIMYLGRIVEEGQTRQIFERPAHHYTRMLIDAIPFPDPDMRRHHRSIEGEIPSLANRPTGCEFHNRCPAATELCRRQIPDVTAFGSRRFRCHHPLPQEAQ